jgi:hypothetical protein
VPAPYTALPCRLVRVVAYQAEQAALWDGPCSGPSGPLPVAWRPVGPRVAAGDPEPPLPDLERGWEGYCTNCGTPVPWDEGTRVSGTVRHLYDTPTRKPEPGDIYVADWLHHSGRCYSGWTNCDGRHLHAVLPNGHPWDIDSRASNCTLPEDTVHRCWVRTGDPPAITVGKGGNTCGAGAGSISAGDYHGFLTDGAFTASL